MLKKKKNLVLLLQFALQVIPSETPCQEIIYTQSSLPGICFNFLPKYEKTSYIVFEK